MTDALVPKDSMTRIAIFLAALLSLAGCEEPFIVFAGGELSGDVASPPENWSAFAEMDTVQLETQPADPYSINIWIAAVEDDLYVATGDDGTNWTQHIEADPSVRVRAGSTIYELEARLVNSAGEQARVSKAYVDKYDLDESDNWVMQGMIFRLDQR